LSQVFAAARICGFSFLSHPKQHIRHHIRT
jgi:hypothetical protein